MVNLGFGENQRHRLPAHRRRTRSLAGPLRDGPTSRRRPTTSSTRTPESSRSAVMVNRLPPNCVIQTANNVRTSRPTTARTYLADRTSTACTSATFERNGQNFSESGPTFRDWLRVSGPTFRVLVENAVIRLTWAIVTSDDPRSCLFVWSIASLSRCCPGLPCSLGRQRRRTPRYSLYGTRSLCCDATIRNLACPGRTARSSPRLPECFPKPYASTG